MGTSLYPDEDIRGISRIMMKKDMSLNLNDQNSSNLKPDLRDAEGILNSPDMGLLKLASPELERLIIQANGMVTTTPTSQFVYPKSVSDEQEFAEGFVKALEDLHKQNQLSGGACVPPTLNRLASSTALALPTDLPVYTNLSAYGSTTVNYSTDTIPFPPPPPPALRDEPQTVPDMQIFGDSPPLSPIDMDTQERIKAERKKLRNRIAASKCRKRKLERISRRQSKLYANCQSSLTIVVLTELVFKHYWNAELTNHQSFNIFYIGLYNS
ncbi:transcription factor jun-D-like [Sinocyclocheilus anshuiensis]|nr:PREDICTED: transcription factor jun-D-like [Sinocyclocheilus anshuiensis]